MLFNSIDFLFFLPIVWLLYWFVFKTLKIQNFFLLIASYYFYAYWNWYLLGLIIFTSISTFVSAKYIDKFLSEKKKIKSIIFLSVNIAINLFVLGIFKYYNFFIKSLCDLLSISSTNLLVNLLLPVGISFYTFQAISYTIDIYRRELTPSNNIIEYCTFVSFFPQLVAGPIERAQNLLPQFQKKRIFNFDLAICGVNFIFYGLFKKVVIADRLAVYVNAVYADLPNATTITTLIASIFFAIQIYCDFSGYTDIARGTAQLFGIELMVNFKRPYLSKSIGEFWSRWHISLSTWFRDYLYIPLGGNRVPRAIWIRNILIVFLVSGLWHGASWTYIIWGGLHGAYLVFERFSNKLISKAIPENPSKQLQFFLDLSLILITFSIVTFAWVFFRAPTISDSFLFLRRFFSMTFSVNPYIICAGKGTMNLFISFLSIFLLILFYMLPQNLKLGKTKSFIFCIIMFVLILLLGKAGHEDFIYFQF